LLASCAALSLTTACGGSAPGGAGVPTSGAGGLLAFAADGNIFTMSPDGKERKQLTKVASGALARDPAWSPDGSKLIYAYSPPLANVRGPGGLLPLPVTDLYVMNADGSNQKVVLEHDAPGAGYESPVWAPDGKSVYVTYTALIAESNIVKDQIVEVARVPLAGGARETLAPNGMVPTLSRDGRRLAYIVTQPDGQSLVVADGDGKNAKTLLPAGKLDVVSSPRFSPDGKQVSFSAAAPMAPIPTVTPPPRRTSFLQPSVARAAALPHGLPMDVFVVDADGANLRRLTQLGEDSPVTAWSPDGKRIAILAGGGIYVMNADGSDFQNVDQHGGHGAIDWRR
jgi:Tol biopolymer transport system component